jgi:hypothetical protein
MHDVRMEFRIAVSAPAGSRPFDLYVEPEGMAYGFPAATKVVLTFRGADAMQVELSHRPDKLIIWRPADTEVWAGTADGDEQQIGGWRDIPAPGLDSGGAALSHQLRTAVEQLFHEPAPPEPRPRSRAATVAAVAVTVLALVAVTMLLVLRDGGGRGADDDTVRPPANTGQWRSVLPKLLSPR